MGRARDMGHSTLRGRRRRGPGCSPVAAGQRMDLLRGLQSSWSYWHLSVEGGEQPPQQLDLFAGRAS